MTKPKIAPNPFTPKSGIEPRVFLGREKEIEIFKKQLNRTKVSYFNHFIVIGDWGIGKTTLLKEYRKISQSQGILTSFVTVPKFTDKTLLSPTVHLMTQIPRSLPIKFEKIKRAINHLRGLGINFPIIGGGLNFPAKQRYKRDPQVLLLDSLVTLWKDLEKEMNVVIVFIDDVQNYEKISEFLTLLKNVLSDDEIAKHTGYLFVLSSTSSGWEDFLVKHHPLGRYFIPIVKLLNLEKERIPEIINGILRDTGVSFEKEVIREVVEYSEGHPFQMQILCDYLYESQVHGKVTMDCFESAFNNALDELGDIILEPLYTLASEQEKGTLHLMAENYTVTSVSEILSLLQGIQPQIDKKSLSVHLNRLKNKGLIQKVNRGHYKIISRIMSEYIRRK